MPKDEFDFADPFELNGMAFFTQEDTTDAMCECFIEEFMRMGHSAQRILALFQNPRYVGMNLVWEKRGEPFVLDKISEVFLRWGRSVSWECEDGRSGLRRPGDSGSVPAVNEEPALATDGALSDPMGGAIPKINL